MYGKFSVGSSLNSCGQVGKKSQVVTLTMKFWMLNNVLLFATGEIRERLRHSAQEIWEIGQTS